MGRGGLTDFDDSLTGFERGVDGRPCRFKSSKEMLRPAVSDTQPKELSEIIRTCGKNEEIFIFGNHDAIFSDGIRPNLAVVALSHSLIQDVNGIMPLCAQPTRKSHR